MAGRSGSKRGSRRRHGAHDRELAGGAAVPQGPSASATTAAAAAAREVAYDAGGQVGKVIFVTVLLVAQAVGIVAVTPLLLAQDGPVLPALLLLLAIASVVGMGVYARCYVRTIEWEDGPAGEAAWVSTLWPGPPMRVTADDIALTTEHAGRLVTPRHHVNAPWTGVRVRGRRLVWIVDAQGSWRRAARTGVLARLGAPPVVFR